MRRLLMKAGVPLVAGALVLTGFSGAAFANAKHPATSKPTFDLAYEGPLSGGNAQLGLNMAVLGRVRRQPGELGKVPFGKLPFKLPYVQKDDQGSATLSPTDAQELVSNTVSHRRRRPRFLRRHQGCRADLQLKPPCNREPVGDPAGARRATDGRTSSGSSPTTASRDQLTPTTSSRSSTRRPLCRQRRQHLRRRPCRCLRRPGEEGRREGDDAARSPARLSAVTAPRAPRSTPTTRRRS